jgi:hypothetical protein
MPHTDSSTSSGPRSSKPIHVARSKTERVQDELSVTAAELHLTNTALARELPATEKKGDVKKALDQNAVAEKKVQQSAEELAHVKQLLEEEEAERARLEHELASKRSA